MHGNKKKHILAGLMMDDERELFRQLVSKNMTVLDAAEIIMENRKRYGRDIVYSRFTGRVGLAGYSPSVAMGEVIQ
jgi:hypothetical protein